MKKWLALLSIILMGACSKQESQAPAADANIATSPAVSEAALAGEKQKLVIYNWTEYLPETVLEAFTKETGIEVEYATYESNEAMYAKLKLLDGKGYDIVVPSTFYVEKMRKEGLLQPIDKTMLKNYGNLDTSAMNKMHDPDNQYSIPYLWGSTAIAINGKDVDASQIKKWADLWKPEYKGKIMLMDDVRDNFYVGLRVCGFNDNSTNEAEIKCAYEKLKSLMPSVKTFNSDSPKTPLIQSNVSIGVIWNGEAYKASEEMENLQYVYPEEGAVIWIDSFAIPKGAVNTAAAHKFIDFMLRAESGKACIEELGYPAPNTAAALLLDEKLRNNKIIFPNKEDVAKGSIHTDIGDANLIYLKYWDLLKAGK
ncbi:MAG: extracellular solute-binding protein [Pseudomonadota bacterium]